MTGLSDLSPEADWSSLLVEQPTIVSATVPASASGVTSSVTTGMATRLATKPIGLSPSRSIRCVTSMPSDWCAFHPSKL